MKTIEEQIKVMQHFANGGEVEQKYICDGEFGNTQPSEKWIDKASKAFDWFNYDYRIKENKQTVTIEKWLFKDKDSYFELKGNIIYLESYAKCYERIKILETYEVEL